MLSPEELEHYNWLKTLAGKKNCVTSHQQGNFRLFRKTGERVVFIGQRQTLKEFEKLVKKA